MERQVLITWLTTQIWQVPFLVLFLCGLVISLSGRWQGKFVPFAIWGFILLIAGWAISAWSQWLMYAHISDGGYSANMARNMALSLFRSVLHLAGMALLMAAIFSGRNDKAPPAAAR